MFKLTYIFWLLSVPTHLAIIYWEDVYNDIKRIIRCGIKNDLFFLEHLFTIPIVLFLGIVLAIVGLITLPLHLIFILLDKFND